MTKLEEKLIDYGYQKRDNYYYKSTYYSYIEIELDNNKEHIINYYVQNNKGQIKRKKVFKTKLEEKLQELGYHKYQTIYYDDYDKPYIDFKKQYCYRATIHISLYDNKIDTYNVTTEYEYFTKQQAIDNLQQAFDTMKKDLKILKEIEQCQD